MLFLFSGYLFTNLGTTDLQNFEWGNLRRAFQRYNAVLESELLVVFKWQHENAPVGVGSARGSGSRMWQVSIVCECVMGAAPLVSPSQFTVLSWNQKGENYWDKSRSWKPIPIAVAKLGPEDGVWCRLPGHVCPGIGNFSPFPFSAIH